MRRIAALAALLALPLHAQFVPPVPIGVQGDTAVGAGAVAEPTAPNWWEVRTPHFAIVSSAGERQTVDVAQKLEVLANSLAAIDARLTPTSEVTTVFLFASRKDSQTWFDLVLDRKGSRSPGVYVSGTAGGTMFLDAAGGWMSQRTVFHELIHDLLSRNGMRLPLWVQEGLAEYFSTAWIRESTVRVGVPNRGHQRRLRLAHRLQLPQMFAAKEAHEVSENALFYAVSWSAVDWLMHRDPAKFATLLTRLDRGDESVAAITEVYGVTMQELQRGVSAGALIDHGRSRVIESVPADRVSSAPLARDQAIVRLATFLGSLDSRHDEARAMLNGVLARNAGAGDALLAHAKIDAAEKKFASAESYLERAGAAAPRDPRPRIELARVLLRDALGVFAGLSEVDERDRPRFLRARELALEARALGARDAEIDALVGTSYLVSGSPAEGIAPLTAAVEARPSREDFKVNLYALLLRSGRLEEAQRFFDERLARGTTQTIAAAMTILLRERIGEVNRLLHESKTGEAMAILREVRDKTPDAEGRSYIDEQIRSVERIHEVNRQITQYNEAVAAVAKREPAKARRILDALLESATDADVIAQAKRLRSQVN